MISNQMIEKTIVELHGITKIHFSVYDVDGNLLATTSEEVNEQKHTLVAFANSPADSQIIGDCQLMRILEDGETAMILAAKGSSAETYMIGSIAVHELQNLIVAYKDKVDKNGFIQSLLLDNLLLVDIYNQAKKLHVDVDETRCVFVLEAPAERMDIVGETLRSLYTVAGGDFITSVDADALILVKTIHDASANKEMEEVAHTIIDMMNTEAMVDVRVAYGTQVHSLKDVSRSYKEARMALDVGRIFYSEKKIAAYTTLGIGRLIYQLPVNLCRIYVQEVFGDVKIEDIDDETLLTVRRFLENNQNVSETSRQLYIHRNTLINRIEKLQKVTGLDIRSFNDAMTLQIAMMVLNYMKYLESVEE